jgi:hypothetical protein
MNLIKSPKLSNHLGKSMQILFKIHVIMEMNNIKPEHMFLIIQFKIKVTLILAHFQYYKYA